MKNKLNVSPQLTNKISVKQTITYAAGGIALFALLFTGAFFYLNLGNSEDAVAANGISSKNNGSWYDANTWNNWSNPNYDNLPQDQAGTFYIDHHVTYGDLRLKSGNTLIISGILEVNSIESNDRLKIEIKNGGKLIVSGDIKGKSDFKLYINENASLEANNISGDAQFKIYNSGSLITNGDIKGKANFDLYVYENASLEANNISGDAQFKIYNSGSLITNGDIKGKANFDLYVYENASLEANNISGNDQFKIYNEGKFNAQGEINAGNNFAITTSHTFEVGSITAGNQCNITNTGTFVSMGDINIKENPQINNSNTLIVIGDINNGNQLTITNGGTTVVTGDIVTKNNFKSYEEDLYVFGDIYNGTHPTITAQWDDNDLMKDDKPLYDLVQQLLNGGSLLPIVLEKFQASLAPNSTVQVEWSTFSEKNNDFFTLERSADGKNFEVLATIDGAGNSNKKLSYSFEDKNPLTGYNYYRLKQTDFNGNFEYFKIVGINNDREAVSKTATLQVSNTWPNPFRDHVNITFDANTDGEAELLIQNALGQVVHKTLFPFHNGENTYAFEEGHRLKSGVYIISLWKNGKKYNTQKLVKM